MDPRAGRYSGDLCLCPTELREELERAVRLTEKLSGLLRRVMPGEPLFVWLLGRDEEVRTLVGAVLSDWSGGAIDTPLAARSIRTYLCDLEQSLYGIYRRTPAGVTRSSTRVRGDLTASVETTALEP
jgi:hypothetical protein